MSAIFREYIFYRRSHAINMYDTEIHCRQEGKKKSCDFRCLLGYSHVNLKARLGYRLSQQTISTYIQSKLSLGEDRYVMKMNENCTHR